MHQRLVDVSRQAGMAEVATSVLHNVGNVLNSVNVSATLISEKVKGLRTPYLGKTVDLIKQHEELLGEFFTTHEKGSRVLGYLDELAGNLTQEQNAVVDELKSLTHSVEHIKEIVSAQQSYAVKSGMAQQVRLDELIESALGIGGNALDRSWVNIVFDSEAIPPIVTDKHKLLQILVNLIANAQDAMAEIAGDAPQLSLRVANNEDNMVRIEVQDSGCGISSENLSRIFSHGFTTKQNGHGFGLHNSALAAKELGGSLSAKSEGIGQGSVFILELPVSTAERDG